MEPAHHPGLAAVLPGQHHHVARPLDEELVEGIGGEPHARAARRWGAPRGVLKRSTSARKSSSSGPAVA